MIDPCTSHCHRKREEHVRDISQKSKLYIAVHPSSDLKLKIAVLLVVSQSQPVLSSATCGAFASVSSDALARTWTGPRS